MATGISIQSITNTDRQRGLQLSATSNIRVLICDPNDNPVNAQILVTGSSGSDGVWGNYSEHPLDGFDVTGMSIEASASGYISETVVGDYLDGVQYEVKIVLVPDTVQFSCTTIFKNKFGITINKPLIDGYVEVKFSGSSPFNKNDYSTTFEAMLQGSTKYSSIVLDNELILEEVDALTYKVSTVQVQGNYCYISNISKNLC